MKKIYTLFAAALAVTGTATAQQLPNGTFDGEWETCYPNAGTDAVGTQPTGWGASNVFQMMSFELVTRGTDRTSSDGNAHSVHMNNTFCGLAFLQIGAAAPAYITLGDAWNHGDYQDLNSENDASDGGSYGGVEFTFRPDAITLWVKRTHATSADAGTVNANEKATVLVYSWKGETTSKVGIGLDMNNTGGTVIDMVNRDKDVLGMITNGVTKSDDFELISQSENYIEGNLTEWTQLTYPIEYLSENEPEMLNIVIASSDYFNRPNLGVDNTLDVDDVALVYYSTLTSLTIGDSEIELTDGTYNYTVNGTMPTSTEDVDAVTKSQSAETVVALDPENNQVTITVTNQGGADIDGETSHIYTVTYQSASTPTTTEYTGYLNASMEGNPFIINEERTITITNNGNGTCTFTLPNFSLGTMQLGDIVVENVTMTEAGGTTTYEGSVTGMQLLYGAIVADVTLNGTINEAGDIDFTIDVLWTNTGGEPVPINVTFTSEPTSSVENVGVDGTAIYGTTGAIAINGYTGTAQVYGITGQLLKSVPVDGNALIDIDGGIYIVRVNGNAAKVLVK